MVVKSQPHPPKNIPILQNSIVTKVIHILFWNEIILNAQFSSAICQAETGFLSLYFGMLTHCLISKLKLSDAQKFES